MRSLLPASHKVAHVNQRGLAGGQWRATLGWLDGALHEKPDTLLLPHPAESRGAACGSALLRTLAQARQQCRDARCRQREVQRVPGLFSCCAHLHSTSKVVWGSTALRILKLMSTVETLGVQEILASSAVASSRAVSICRSQQVQGLCCLWPSKLADNSFMFGG